MHRFHAWLDEHEVMKFAVLMLGVVAPSVLGMSVSLEANNSIGFVMAGGWLAFWALTRWHYLTAHNR